MLPKKNRTNRKNLADVFRGGRYIGSDNLSLKFIKRKNGPPRVSFIVPKTVVLNVPRRNALKRKGYLALEGHLEKLPPGLVGAFIFGKKSPLAFEERKTGREKLEEEIKKILEKL